MADYIYLLENRLAPAQRTALRTVREVARAKGLTIFLVGGAVRDLTSGSPVRDLDVVIQGNALKLKKDLEKAGAIVSGETEAGQALFLRFPGGVRLEFGSTLSITYPKPGKPVAKPATILEDLRRRDFTANAMALSLNDGSYGLLMDPLNGVADIENRQLRLISPYGFIEDPIRMVRAARLMARLGWTLDEKTESRYETGKQEGYISAMSEFHRGYELEEVVHEEDPLRIVKRLESEGWMKFLAPYWTAAKVNIPELERMREAQTQLQMQGIHPDAAAANFPLLTAKLSVKEIATLKAMFPRRGFVQEIDTLEAEARDFATQLGGKGGAAPSQAWKMLTSGRPEVVLWTAFSSKSPAIQAKFKSFYSEWPQARQKMPYTLMQEMRIVPELPGYEELLETLFFELMDGKLSTPEEMKAFLEPYSPPAPPPPVNLRRQRAAKKESKPSKSRSKKTPKGEPSVEDELTEQPDSMEADTDSELEADELSGEEPASVPAAVKKSAPTSPAVTDPGAKAQGKGKQSKAASLAGLDEKSAAKPVAKTAGKSMQKAVEPAKKAASGKSVPAVPIAAEKMVTPQAKAGKGIAVSVKAAPQGAKKASPAPKTAAKKSVPGKSAVPSKTATKPMPKKAAGKR